MQRLTWCRSVWRSMWFRMVDCCRWKSDQWLATQKRARPSAQVAATEWLYRFTRATATLPLQSRSQRMRCRCHERFLVSLFSSGQKTFNLLKLAGDSHNPSAYVMKALYLEIQFVFGCGCQNQWDPILGFSVHHPF